MSISALACTEGVALAVVTKAFRRVYDRTPIVALATGFAYEAHFTRVFKRETALTPGQYRRLSCSGGPLGTAWTESNRRHADSQSSRGGDVTGT